MLTRTRQVATSGNGQILHNDHARAVLAHYFPDGPIGNFMMTTLARFPLNKKLELNHLRSRPPNT